MVTEALNRVWPTDDPNEQYIHVWVAGLALFLLLYLAVLKKSFGSRAI